MKVFIISLLLSLLTLTNAQAHGHVYGAPGFNVHTTFECPEGEYIRAIAVKYGSKVHGMAFRCTTGGWSQWYGDQWSGAYGQIYADGWGFCGAGFNADDQGIHRVCVDDAGGVRSCFGSSAVAYHTDRQCDDSPQDNRARITGFRMNPDWYIFAIQPIWDEPDSCKDFVSVHGSPWHDANGDYQFERWFNGHQAYKRVPHIANGETADTDVCLFYENRRWKFNRCHRMGADASIIALESEYQYARCVYDLGGNSHWQEWTGTEWDNIYPQLQIQALEALPLTWGNTVLFWKELLAPTQGYGGKITVGLTREAHRSNSKEYTAEEQQGFENIQETTEEHGATVSVTANSFGVVEHSAQYDYATSTSISNSNSVVLSTAEAVSFASTYILGASASCESNLPTDCMFSAYIYTAYRPSSEHNSGMSKPTCAIQYQTDDCQRSAPNCPYGTCRDSDCVFCDIGQKPLTPYREFMTKDVYHLDCVKKHTAGQNCPFDLLLRDWDHSWHTCCNSDNQCGEGEGDCDDDSDCLGDLVCLYNQPGYKVDDGWHFDICGPAPPSRRLLELEETTSESVAEDRIHQDTDNVEDVEKEMEHEPAHGCHQFDEEFFCERGPLSQFCQWNSGKCETKENVNEDEIPDTDFTWVYKVNN